MEINNKNNHVKHPKDFFKREEKGIKKFNTALALKITNAVGSMWSAYLFAILSILSLPAILVLISPGMRHDFPKWIIATSLITLIAWISQNFLQLVLLPIIMVGQNVIQGHQKAKADADHETLTYLANLQDQQMKELENQTRILEMLKNRKTN
ncbi:MAG TPA: hypothetical protein VMV24_00535 [Candidatus Dormibacteraeota bacterium]|nr:hypothetical protein [Candidatus Dormibacteraeota bacterium]